MTEDLYSIQKPRYSSATCAIQMLRQLVRRSSNSLSHHHGLRALSTKVPPPEEPPTTALVLTPYQKVAATARGGMYMGFAGLAVVCGFFIVKELFPTRMNPNSLFNEALDQLKSHPDIADKIGTPIRGYGRDHGGHREGRRNFIENVELKDKDGTPRLRIKFNMKGPYGHAYVFAETKKGMSAGEWVYLIVQFTRTGETLNVVDNRHILQAESKGEQDALRQLLQGDSSYRTD